MYFKLVRCYPRKEQYGDTLQLCKHCHILSWKVCVFEVAAPDPIAQPLRVSSTGITTPNPFLLQLKGKVKPILSLEKETLKDLPFLNPPIHPTPHIYIYSTTHPPQNSPISLCTQLFSFSRTWGILGRGMWFWGWALAYGCFWANRMLLRAQTWPSCSFSRALTTPALPITQRAAPCHFHPRTLSTCSSSESQHMTALQKGPPLIGWLGLQELDTAFVNSVHFNTGSNLPR